MLGAPIWAIQDAAALAAPPVLWPPRAPLVRKQTLISRTETLSHPARSDVMDFSGHCVDGFRGPPKWTLVAVEPLTPWIVHFTRLMPR